MEILSEIWGTGSNLNTLQMSCRGVSIFLIALAFIRISGRRSFGVGTPLDNIIVILLGAILSRGVVGASPFIPVVVTSFVIVLLHRLFGWYKVHHIVFSKIIDGEKIVLFKDGNFIQENMDKALVCEEDIRQGVRESALVNDLKKIDMIFIERNGKISVIKKTVG